MGVFGGLSGGAEQLFLGVWGKSCIFAFFIYAEEKSKTLGMRDEGRGTGNEGKNRIKNNIIPKQRII